MIELAVLLIALNGPDGQVIWVNPEQVVSIRSPRDYKDSTLSPTVECAIEMADGKFVNVVETCDSVVEKVWPGGHP